MKISIFIVVIIALFSVRGLSQISSQYTPGISNEHTVGDVINLTVLGDPDDPAYKTYKAGYDLILDEQWESARKRFLEVISKYPKCDYVEDAQYWTAYAFKHEGNYQKKAIDAYNKFIKDYPKSKYYDDAVADLAELKQEQAKVIKKLTVKGDAQVYVTPEGYFMREGTQRMRIGEDGVVIGEGPESLVVDKHGITISGDGKSFRYSYGFSPQAKTFEHAMKLYSGRMNRIQRKVGTPIPVPDANLRIREDIDPEMRLKLETIYLLSEAKEDDKSYTALKDIILDYKKPRPLREAALEVLSEFEKHDSSPIYLEVAKNDTNEDMQLYAIDYLNQLKGDKNKTISILINLFNTLPKQRKEQRQMIFYSIADVGNEKVVDFLSSVAKRNEDYDLRRDAIYYLGSIGGEKAREALFEILKQK